MNKIKPIKRLRHQFGSLITTPRLDAYEIFDILLSEGLIEPVAFGDAERPTHYRECFGERVTYDALLKTVTGLLLRYCEGTQKTKPKGS